MDIEELDLTDAKIWQPILKEVERVLEQRELLKASLLRGERRI